MIVVIGVTYNLYVMYNKLSSTRISYIVLSAKGLTAAPGAIAPQATTDSLEDVASVAAPRTIAQLNYYTALIAPSRTVQQLQPQQPLLLMIL